MCSVNFADSARFEEGWRFCCPTRAAMSTAEGLFSTRCTAWSTFVGSSVDGDVTGR